MDVVEGEGEEAGGGEEELALVNVREVGVEEGLDLVVVLELRGRSEGGRGGGCCCCASYYRWVRSGGGRGREGGEKEGGHGAQDLGACGGG